ncbi:synaptic vesicle glycoprotein 2C-like [Lycorma delicatula]|uniref:synaptic vesicle glycoprotein 2C-like n=1 Tax=Lycorma delicatula TaxID=130591 RepID=UPI003F515A06
MKMPQRQSLSHGRGSLESNAISNTSIMGSPHGAAMPYNNQLRDSIVSLGGSSDLERMVLRKVDRNSKVEIAVDMDVAIEETGQGRFQICLWLICGLIYSCCSLSTTTLSFVLPAATCDFHLSASDKGTLNIMPVAGMMIGSYVWGSFADSKGRNLC